MSLYFQPTPIRTQDSTMATAPDEGLDIPALIDSLTNRIVSSEKIIEQKVSANALAKILLTENDIVLMADKISLIGQINMFDWVRDISGNITGGIDPSSVTRIVGGKIQTGVIESVNWTTTTGSKIDLDNGTIVLGGSLAPKFSVSTAGVVTCQDAIVHGTLQANSVITNSATIDGVTIGTVKGNAAAGYAIQQALEVTGTTILKGVLVPTDTGAMKCGTIAWDSSTGAWTSGSGIAITEYGIVGANGSNTTFTIDTSGNATFAGSLSAATGTFSGTVSAGAITSSSYIDVSGYVRASGVALSGDTYAAIIGDVSTSNPTRVGVSGFSGDGGTGVFGNAGTSGVTGTSGSGIGVYGSATTGTGIKAESSFGTALSVLGPMTISSTALVTNLQADSVDGTHIGAVSSGAATATFPGNNKPGSATSNTWLTITKDGTTYYIPVWT